MNQGLGKRSGSAMMQSELQDDRIHILDKNNRFQWKCDLSFGSESEENSSSIKPIRKDMQADPMTSVSGSVSHSTDPVSDRHSVQCPEILDAKCSRQPKHANFKKEYLNPTTPTRSSLRTGRSPSRSKEGAHVTFAQDCPEDCPLRKGSSSHTEGLLSAAAERPGAWCFSTYRRRGEPQWSSQSEAQALSQSHDQARKVMTFDPCTDLWPCHANCESKTTALDTKKELESSTSRLLKLTSALDPYIATHLPDGESPFGCLAEEPQRQGSPNRSLSPDRSLNGQPSGPQGSSNSYSSCLLSPPTSPPEMKSKELPSSISTLRTTVSSYHPLTTIRNDPNMDSEAQGLTGHESSCLTRASLTPVSQLSSVLRQLLDLVDHHWAGPHSLQLNPQFLTPAYDLLSSLVPPSPVKRHETGRSPGRRAGQGGEQRERTKDRMKPPGMDSADLKHWKKLPTHTKWQMVSHQTASVKESQKKSLATLLEENHSSQFQAVNSKPESTLKIPKSCWLWNQCLQRQVKALREQERHFKQLKETMDLLQDSHRSLISSSNSLMENLSSPTSSQDKDTLQFSLDLKEGENGLCSPSMCFPQSDHTALQFYDS
ncbi:hypothetical protein AGOR_G00169820 [Albula goreensis]|uniref:Uncharacterized protein n=1 Tax=Albula goreensis TaxID=1534307 RepID=A0A8T3D154_9TELE|nr:hypothetical protein AGOR_G00169820 [Albula goreensis]